MFTFKHYLNKIKYISALRIFGAPCEFIKKIKPYLNISSLLLNEIKVTFMKIYDTELVFEQDRDAVLARILFVQNHESQTREAIH